MDNIKESIITAILSILLIIGMIYIALNLGLSPEQKVLWYVLIAAHIIYFLVGMWESKVALGFIEDIKEIEERREVL